MTRAARSRAGACACAWTVAALSAALLAGCAGSDQPPTVLPSFAVPPAPGSLPPDHIPTTSPPLAVQPAGELIRLDGDRAQGVVADPITHVVVVALGDPARLELIDGAKQTPLVVVGVPGTASHLQLAGLGGPVIVPAEDTGTVSLVALPSGQVTSTLVVPHQPYDAAQAAGGGIVVTDERGAAVWLLTGRQSRIIDVGLSRPEGVGAAGERVAVVGAGDHTVRVYDGRTGVRLGEVSFGAGLTNVVPVGPDRVAVADTAGEAIYVVRIAPTVEVEQRVALNGSPFGLAADLVRQRLYVTLTGSNQLIRYDIGSEQALTLVPGAVPTVRQPNSLAVESSSGRIYIASATDGELQVLEPPP